MPGGCVVVRVSWKVPLTGGGVLRGRALRHRGTLDNALRGVLVCRDALRVKDSADAKFECGPPGSVEKTVELEEADGPRELDEEVLRWGWYVVSRTNLLPLELDSESRVKDSANVACVMDEDCTPPGSVAKTVELEELDGPPDIDVDEEVPRWRWYVVSRTNFVPLELDSESRELELERLRE